MIARRGSVSLALRINRWLGQKLAEFDLGTAKRSPASNAPVVNHRGIAAANILRVVKLRGAALPQPPPIDIPARAVCKQARRFFYACQRPSGCFLTAYTDWPAGRAGAGACREWLHSSVTWRTGSTGCGRLLCVTIGPGVTAVNSSVFARAASR